MNIGEKIKKVRKLRGITLKGLGMQVGFNEQYADVRIAQYESGKRIPKKGLKETMAKVLEVNPLYLVDYSIKSADNMLFALIDIEDVLGLSIRLIDGIPCIQLNADASELLMEWYIMKYNLSKNIITNEEYLDWKYNISIKK